MRLKLRRGWYYVFEVETVNFNKIDPNGELCDIAFDSGGFDDVKYNWIHLWYIARIFYKDISFESDISASHSMYYKNSKQIYFDYDLAARELYRTTVKME
jgi:hypothetical protein